MLPEEYVMTVNDDDVEETYNQMSVDERRNGECAGAFMFKFFNLIKANLKFSNKCL